MGDWTGFVDADPVQNGIFTIDSGGDPDFDDNGTNDPEGSGDFPNDIKEDAREGTWDIGAYEYTP